jgi:NADH-quinone oxidoreductase subunit J
LAASVLVFGLLGAILFSIDAWRTSGSILTEDGTKPAPTFLAARAEHEGNLLSKPAGETEFGTLRGLGRSLFGDYLFAVEVAGTILVLAAVGAIAIAPRTRRGTL